MRLGERQVNAAQVPDLAGALRSGPFHSALRAAIVARQLPLHRVRHHLARRGVTIGLTSLSYWQQGARRPQRPESMRAVRALEEILELPEESLIRLLGPVPEAATPKRPATRSYRSLTEASGAVERLLAELETPLDGGLHTVGHHERVRIGAHRQLQGRDSQQIVRAHRDGVDRYMAIHHGAPGCSPADVAVYAMENCRTGRVRWDDGTGVVIAELLFDARLRAGDTHMFQYGFEDGTARSATEYVRGFGSAGRRVRAPGPVRGRRAARALPPLRPAVGRGPARRPPRTRAERPPPVGAHGGAAGAGGPCGDRVGLGVRGPGAGCDGAGSAGSGSGSCPDAGRTCPGPRRACPVRVRRVPRSA